MRSDDWISKLALEEQYKDYYIDENGRRVFTAHFHLKRGYCCGNGCRHCPYEHENVKR
jgi:hypothetical protein